jgi:hypothetical protein
MNDSFRRLPFGLLALSLITLFAAIYGTVTGRVWLRSDTYSRAKNPEYYWFALAFYYFVSALLIGTAISSISN